MIGIDGIVAGHIDVVTVTAFQNIGIRLTEIAISINFQKVHKLPPPLKIKAACQYKPECRRPHIECDR